MNCATETEKPKIVRVVNVSDKKEVLYVCTTLLFLLVEPRGVEPLSENIFTQASPSAVTY